MIFSELYSVYYNTVAKILEAVISGETDEKALQRIVTENAFGESVMTVIPALKSGKWQLICNDMTTPILNVPSMPLTELQKRWLKAVSLDKRVKLFDIEFKGLEGIEPLFTESDYFVYDQYSDGDCYSDIGYIERFGIILEALKNRTPLEIESYTRTGNSVKTRCMPVRLEYSEKDDKFRLITAGCRYLHTVNLGRIKECRPVEKNENYTPKEPVSETECVVLRITNERNALERCMMHFAHFEKQAERLDRNHYLLKVKYDKSDEMEMVIRVLSFGPNIEAAAPDSFRKLIIEKLKKQKICKEL